MKRIVGVFDHSGLQPRQDRLPPGDTRKVSGPYKVDLLMELGYDLRVVRPARSRAHKKVRDVVEHRSGVFMDVALRSIPLVFGADAVLAMLESRAVTPAWFKRHGLPPYARPRLGALSCWWGEELRHASPREVQRVLRVIEDIDVLFVGSSQSTV